MIYIDLRGVKILFLKLYGKPLNISCTLRRKAELKVTCTDVSLASLQLIIELEKLNSIWTYALWYFFLQLLYTFPEKEIAKQSFSL